MEVIVCDDGSSDDTFSTVKAFENQLQISYCYQPDLGFRAASARNMGIRLAKGTLILLIDCGVFTPPNLLKEHLLAHTLTKDQSIVVGPIHGHWIEEQTFWEQVRLEENDWWSVIAENRALMDSRMSLWESVDFQIDRLSVPWSMCWACNISVSRMHLVEIGGFDDSFVGWGGEDIDFAYRLYKQGLSFYVNDKAFVIHLPHDNSMRSHTSNQLNKRRIYRKDPVLETELLVCCSVLNYNQEFSQIKESVRHKLIPNYMEHWDKSALQYLKSILGSPVWLLGSGNGELATFLDCSCACDPDQEKVERTKRKYPWLDVRCCMGVNTGLSSNALDAILITDFWRILPERVALEIIKEANRVAHHVIILWTPNLFCSNYFNTTDTQQITHLSEILQSANLQLSERYFSTSSKIFEVI
jgi:glycosyltransferase involved in cell wall biosynthesis